MDFCVRLRQCHSNAARYDKTVDAFLGDAHLAAASVWPFTAICRTNSVKAAPAPPAVALAKALPRTKGYG